jgi:23S rRNA (cytidine1920-2'-O)/16S rRNA (cytidine1409-2'-O)-methyltransferase
MAGEVKANGTVITKAGQMVGNDSEIEIGAGKIPFVSRGGLKLDAAIAHFGVPVAGKTAMDVGASTGGFTDCLLQKGAEKVYAVDVGYGLIDARLRTDRRVILVEKTNFRYLEKSAIPDCIDIATVDVSFISVTKILPRVAEFLCGSGEVLVLVKPQFEVGRGHVGKGGIVRDEHKRLEAVHSVVRAAVSMGFESLGTFESPVKGQKGNVEYFLYLKKGRTCQTYSCS